MTAPTTLAPTPANAPAQTSPIAPGHSYFEDFLGIVTGSAVASFGLFLLTSATVVTGGTAGLSLLISYLAPVHFGLVFAVINLPFFVLAVQQKGWIFTAKTATAVALVAVFSVVHPAAVHITGLNPVWAVVIGNLLAGLGIIILFRHGASLGGFNILALLLQERLGWRAGYVQMAFDVIVVLGSFAVVALPLVLLSAAGAVIMNLLIALNHRPGRYFGSQPR